MLQGGLSPLKGRNDIGNTLTVSTVFSDPSGRQVFGPEVPEFVELGNHTWEVLCDPKELDDGILGHTNLFVSTVTSTESVELETLEKDVINPLPRDRIRVPCSINGKFIHALVDTGAERSLLDETLASQLGLKLTPAKGQLKLATQGHYVERVGFATVKLAVGNQLYTAVMEIANLDGEKAIFGMDLIVPLNIRLLGLPLLWPTDEKESIVEPIAEVEYDYPTGVVDGVDPRWKKVLEDQTKIPKTSLCCLPNTTVRLDMKDDEPIYIPQYKIPLAYKEVISNQIDDWMSKDIIEIQPDYNCQI